MNFRNFFYSKYCLWRYFKIDIRIFINFKNYKYIIFFGMCILRKFEIFCLFLLDCDINFDNYIFKNK